MILASHGIIASSGGITFDTDALSFITAASITDSTQQTAINTLVTDLKSYNIWSKMKAIYPFVGGTATSHRFNLKTPTTNSSDFYLTPYGGINHASTGVKFNGTTGYFDTQLNQNSHLTKTSYALGVYSRLNLTDTGFIIDAFDANTGGNGIYGRYSVDGNAYYAMNVNGQSIIHTENDTRGLYTISRTSSVLATAYKNEISKATNTNAQSGNATTSSFFIGCRNDAGTPSLYTTTELAFAYISDGLNSTEASNLYTAVQLYQTTLSRNV
jgi:hypothetical protein